MSVIDWVYKQGLADGRRQMELDLLLAAEKKTAVELGGRAYYIRSDLDNLQDTFAALEGENNVRHI